LPDWDPQQSFQFLLLTKKGGAWEDILQLIFFFFCHRVLPGESYFNVLPPQVSEYDVVYSQACHCASNTTAGTYSDADCYNAFEVAFPTIIGDRRRRSPLFLCDRQKRDIQLSDEPREDDFHLFQRTLPLHKRHKRESGLISKENATYYCEERISKTNIGKLCAKLGINVQALVDVCSFDVEVTCLRFSLEMRCLILYLNYVVWLSYSVVTFARGPSKFLRIPCARG